MDAIVALMIVAFLYMTVYNLDLGGIHERTLFSTTHMIAEDGMNAFTVTKFGELPNTTLHDQIMTESIVSEEDDNKPLLDIIGILWASGRRDLAANLSKYMISSMLPDKYEYCLVVEDEGTETSIYCTPGMARSKIRTSARRLVSGYKSDTPIKRGYAARGVIRNPVSIKRGYAYYGGFIGQGNITRFLNLGDLDTVFNATMEMDAHANFSLYINGVYSGRYNTTGEHNLTADSWQIPPQYWSNFKPGENNITLVFNTINNASIGGGYLLVKYNTSAVGGGLPSTPDYAIYRYYFPGIDGLINVYDSFFVPGEIHNATINLTLRTNYTTVLVIGNATIWMNDTNGTWKNIVIDNQSIAGNLSLAGLSYQDISEKTVPVRLGVANIEELNLEERRGANADAFVITDISGSMAGSKLAAAKEADSNFTSMFMAREGTREGLVAYSTTVLASNVLSLRHDNASLQAEIDSYTAGGGTCTPCGERVARLNLEQTIETGQVLYSGSVTLCNTSYTGGTPPDDHGRHWYSKKYLPEENWTNCSLYWNRMGYTSNWTISGDWDDTNTTPQVDFNTLNTTGNTYDVLPTPTVTIDSTDFSGGNWNGWTVTIVSGSPSTSISSGYFRVWGSPSYRVYLQKSFSTLGYGSVGLSFTRNGYSLSSTDYYKVEWSTDGATWNTLYTESNGDNGWYSRSILLPRGAANQPVLYVRFVFVAIDNSWWWSDSNDEFYIDDIVLRGGVYNPVDDGWDWATTGNVFDYDSSRIEYTTPTGNAKRHALEFITGTGTGSEGADRNNCNNYDCSGAYGLFVNITQDEWNRIVSDGHFYLYFDYEWTPRYRYLGGSTVFDSGDDLWIKAVWTNLSDGTAYYLGSSLDPTAEDPDSYNEIVFEDNPSNIVSGSYTIDLYQQGLVSGPGGYYLELGGKLRADDPIKWGFFRFDNVLFTTDPGLISGSGYYYFRKHIRVNTTRWKRLIIHVRSDQNATVWWNGKIVDYDNKTSRENLHYAGGRYYGWDRNIIIEEDQLEENNTLAIRLYSTGTPQLDVEIIGVNNTRERAMLVMTDGASNRCFSEIDCDTTSCDSWSSSLALQEVPDEACEAFFGSGTRVYTVGFQVSAGSNAQKSMQRAAKCGGGEYYDADVNTILEIYSDIAQKILEAAEEKQAIIVIEGQVVNETLSPYSYIEFNYTPAARPEEYGDVLLTLQSPQFGGEVESPKTGSITVPPGTELVELGVTSYSSSYWTSLVKIKNQTGGWETRYNLSLYGVDYKRYGDPYIVDIPVARQGYRGVVNVSLDTGYPNETTTGTEIVYGGGSPNASIIYTLAVSTVVGYGDTFPRAEGCKNYTVTTEDGKRFNVSIGNESDVFDPDRDALDDLLVRLFERLDVDGNGLLDVYPQNPDDIEVRSILVPEVPWMYGPIVVRLDVGAK